jgi:tRNA-Thr(GGU) m(6)t(6)A37 methyltransferase TsaA
MEEILTVKPIAHIRTDFKEKFGVPRQSGIVNSVKGLIIFTEEFRDGQSIRCLDDFSHIWLLWGFSENENKWSHTVRPPKLGGNKRVGVFASRSPFRPNPIGMSSVKIEDIYFDKTLGPVIVVSGSDMVDGTPIYDIKPYIPYSDCHTDASGGYSMDVKGAYVEVLFTDEAALKLPSDIISTIKEILEQDPHPAYKSDKAKIYNLCFGEYDIKFTHNGELITVCDVIKNI